jgi:transposase-like protein
MRQVTRYSAAIKASVLAKALAPNAPGVVELANEFNIPIGTIYTWKSNMLKKKYFMQVKAQRPNDKTAEAKLQALIDTAGMTELELGAYCREHGIYTHNLDEWKQQSLAGFTAGNEKPTKADKQAAHENKKLKSELHRKDKALAEVSALLILKKKADLLWGTIDEEDL